MTQEEITAAGEREKYKKVVEESLLGQGYLHCQNEAFEDFRNRIGFVPDLLLEHESSDRLAIVIRETSAFDDEDWLAQQVALKRGDLRGTRVGLLVQYWDIPEYGTIKGSLLSGVEILSLDSSGVRVLFGPQHSESIGKIDAQAKTAVQQRYYQNKRIPDTVSMLLQKVSNLTYASLLRDFASDYERKTIQSYAEEADFVFGYLKQLLEAIPEGEKVVQSVDLLRLLEEFVQRDGKNRDHFFHQFQTFLLGSIVLDSNYQEMNRSHRSLFLDSPNANLDYVWATTALCHDLLRLFESPIAVYAGSLELKLYYVREPAEILNSFYLHATQQRIQNSWNLDDYPRMPGTLSEILVKHANLNNHGVKMALQLVSKGKNYPPDILSSYICPAALAIAFHDVKVWRDLIGGKIFPLDISKFPLVSLLIYCDGVQEWGRPGRDFDPKGQQCALVDFAAESRKVSSKLWFKDKARAGLTRVSHEYAAERCFMNPIIDLKIDVVSD